MELIYFIFWAFLAACLEMSFQAYMEEDMILAWWWKIIKKWSQSNNRILKELAMPLGTCKFCNGFWLATIVFLIQYKDVEFSLLYLLLFTGLNYVFIRLLIILKF